MEKGHIENLIIEHDQIVFYAKVADISEHSISMDVFEITAWCEDNEKWEPCEEELYLSARIKWDGCCHITFGNIDPDTNKQDGYIHMCGIETWKRHVKLMKKIHKFAEKAVDNFEDDERWENDESI